MAVVKGVKEKVHLPLYDSSLGQTQGTVRQNSYRRMCCGSFRT